NSDRSPAHQAADVVDVAGADVLARLPHPEHGAGGVEQRRGAPGIGDVVRRVQKTEPPNSTVRAAAASTYSRLTPIPASLRSCTRVAFPPWGDQNSSPVQPSPGAVRQPAGDRRRKARHPPDINVDRDAGPHGTPATLGQRPCITTKHA